MPEQRRHAPTQLPIPTPQDLQVRRDSRPHGLVRLPVHRVRGDRLVGGAAPPA
ncbi:hypothetical protein [Winogradskya humida]|uniref:hypothetical protein n=1 Tax=Winogradskya humida TaxID=113566 RepID=UPI001943F644|nr:hypothetical protein [Actinoplanes humidus]